MAKISKETVSHVAKLCRLGLTEAEVARFSSQLSAVFEYMEVLNEVDTSGVSETAQVTGLANVSEKDEEGLGDFGGAGGSSVGIGEELLECSELPVMSRQVLVKSVIKK